MLWSAAYFACRRWADRFHLRSWLSFRITAQPAPLHPPPEHSIMVLQSNRISERRIVATHPSPSFLDLALMKILRLAVALLLAPSASILLAQPPAPAKDAPPPATEPLVVHVHPSRGQ